MATVNPFQPVPVASALDADITQTIGSAPKVSAATLLNAAAADKQALVDIHELLTRLYVRNRNQHRRSHWFKSLCQFRKQLGLLIAEMDGANGGSVIEQRLRFWDSRCIHQWYLYLVAAGQFAVVGLVLMATTARVCKVTGITEFYEEIGSEDMKVVLKTVDEGVVVSEFGNLLAGEELDIGEVVEREE
ncbi:hypothetical protein K469DRAFT_671033 [Zopfia rhizophila CBS 207.26]|uniref:RNase MRP protein 1 RNA binding domain-containing protein n=1 Tax=Zopfia rhizophila CBS 207.26 TaxID=1314779 RepID=A0A6A6DV09_9PEZI|nr:hypothetical protein K469DRAFT_671033 [Zopfia rhizophila CBS 207.26]